jgi:hypothetical protein
MMHNMDTPRRKLSDEVRQALIDCGQTRYAVSKATGIAESTLSRFVAGERWFDRDNLDILCQYLDLHLVRGRRRPKRK